MPASSRPGINGMRGGQIRYPLGLVLWVLFFCYSTSAALLFQKLLLPLIPSLHAGMGLLDGDSLYFHSIAINLADSIRLHGWGSWGLYSAPGATGNVAILGALYAIFRIQDPALIIPVNAAVHALGGILIFKIGQLLVPGNVGRAAGIATALLFVGFPSALNWYGQVHKDGYAIAGALILIYEWLHAGTQAPTLRSLARFALAMVGAVILIAVVRPYNLIPTFAVMVVLFVLMWAIEARAKSATWKMLGIYLLGLAILGAGAVWAKASGINEKYEYLELPDWRWQPSGWMPDVVEGPAESAARTRAGLIVHGQKIQAGSMIDTDVRPDNVLAVAAYAPRALQIALFAPFPGQWLEKISLARLVALGEMVLWYLLAPGVVIALLRARSTGMVMVICFAALFLYIYGFTIANLGTLYRIRYPYLFLFMLIGAIGWTQLLLSKPRQEHRRPDDAVDTSLPPPAADTAVPRMSRSGIFSAGVTVAIFAALTYAGLFLRDMILARWFGIGPELDALFIATAVPMFLVTAFSIPLGIMLVPQFLAARAQQSAAVAQQLVSSIAGAYVLFVIPLALALFIAAPEVLSFVTAGFAADKFALTVTLFRWMLPVLALSGLVVISNGLLNALGKFSIPAASQIAVPAASILAFVVFGKPFGVAAAVAGMLAGQMLNLWLVVRALRRCGYSPFPRRIVRSRRLLEAGSQYLPLVASALFVSIAAPVNMNMASNLAEGSMAALGLGNKVVIFATGIIGAAVTTVILPHFSSFMARNRLLDIRNELSFFLLAGTVITIPLTLMLFVGSEAIVRLAFEGGAFAEADVQSVAKVVSYGIIQLPFYTINLLMLKFAIATRHAGRVMLASLLGLSINIGLNLVFMAHSGAAGIALATTLATAFSTCLLLLLFNRLGHIAWMDIVLVFLNWMLYTTFVICVHYHSYSGVVVAVIGLATLLYAEWKVLVRWRATA